MSLKVRIIIICSIFVVIIAILSLSDFRSTESGLKDDKTLEKRISNGQKNDMKYSDNYIGKTEAGSEVPFIYSIGVNSEPEYFFIDRGMRYYSTNVVLDSLYTISGEHAYLGKIIGLFQVEYINNSRGWEREKKECTVYEIENIDKEFAVAVELNDRYYVFGNHDFSTRDIKSLLSAAKQGQYFVTKYSFFLDDNGNIEAKGDRILDYSDGREDCIKDFFALPCYYDSFSKLYSERENYLVLIEDEGKMVWIDDNIVTGQMGRNTIRIFFDCLLLGEWNHSIDLYENGYFSIELCDKKLYYYIGEESYDKFLEYLKKQWTIFDDINRQIKLEEN